jgi:hypothetical protein
MHVYYITCINKIKLKIHKVMAVLAVKFECENRLIKNDEAFEIEGEGTNTILHFQMPMSVLDDVGL